MVWVFWVIVCVVLFLLMWPAFEQQLPPELKPFAKNMGLSTAEPPPPSQAGPLGSSSKMVAGWYLQQSAGGWLMSKAAELPVNRPGLSALEPPRLYTSCAGFTWVEARAALDVRKDEELIVRARLDEKRFEFEAASARLISMSPAEVNSALSRAPEEAYLRIKVPYRAYGVQDMAFALGHFERARKELLLRCERSDAH